MYPLYNHFLECRTALRLTIHTARRPAKAATVPHHHTTINSSSNGALLRDRRPVTGSSLRLVNGAHRKVLLRDIISRSNGVNPTARRRGNSSGVLLPALRQGNSSGVLLGARRLVSNGVRRRVRHLISSRGRPRPCRLRVVRREGLVGLVVLASPH